MLSRVGMQDAFLHIGAIRRSAPCNVDPLIRFCRVSRAYTDLRNSRLRALLTDRVLVMICG